MINVQGRIPSEKQNYRRKKLTGKGKYIVKIDNHPHTKLVGRLRDISSKIICICNKQLRVHKTIQYKTYQKQ